jgi:nucleoredoxin
MKTLFHSVLVFLFLSCGFLTASAGPDSNAEAAEFRNWHMITGGHFEARIVSVGNRSVTLENREGRSIDFPLADLLPSDRNYARAWQMERDSHLGGGATAAVALSAFGKQIHDNLVELRGSRLTSIRADLQAAPQYYAFYKSAAWCPPCRQFTPDLVSFYDRQKRRSTPFELIFISSDYSEKEMMEYMRDYKMRFPALPFEKMKNIVSSNGRGIPNLIVTDADGNKILDSYDASGKYVGPRHVMAEFEKLLSAANR